MTPATPRFLPWDSEHFGVRIARVDAPSDADDWLAIDDWAAANNINCMYVFANGRDRLAIRLAEEHAARTMDDRTILEAIVVESPAVHGVRAAFATDLTAMEEIAAYSFTESRFYRDPNFPRSLSESLFRKWIRRSVDGYAQAVLVAGEPGSPTGFITCRDGKIDLLAVAESARGQGIGKLLTTSAKHWFAAQGMRRASVLARSSNETAIRLYERCGFVRAASEYVFHKWYVRP